MPVSTNDHRAPIDANNAENLKLYRTEIEGVLNDIFVQLRDTCEELAEAICQRRTNLVAGRVDDVEAFRWVTSPTAIFSDAAGHVAEMYCPSD